MSDLPKQHDQEKSAELLEESGGVQQQDIKTGEELGSEAKEQEVEVKEPISENDSSVTEEKKADVTGTTEHEDKTVAESVEAVAKDGEAESTGATIRDGQPEAAERKEGGGDAVGTSTSAEKEAKDPEVEKVPTSNEPVSTNVSADPSPAVSLAALRPLSPSSRTSTPPLTATTTAPAAKKFSSINVNKKFLSKTGSPSPAGAAAATKLNPLASKSSYKVSRSR